MGTFAVDLFTEEASFPLEYFAAVNKLCCSLPLSDGPGTLTLPASCLARSPNRPSFSPRRKASLVSHQVPKLRSLQYPDCILFL